MAKWPPANFQTISFSTVQLFHQTLRMTSSGRWCCIYNSRLMSDVLPGNAKQYVIALRIVTDGIDWLAANSISISVRVTHQNMSVFLRAGLRKPFPLRVKNNEPIRQRTARFQPKLWLFDFISLLLPCSIAQVAFRICLTWFCPWMSSAWNRHSFPARVSCLDKFLEYQLTSLAVTIAFFSHISDLFSLSK